MRQLIRSVLISVVFVLLISFAAAAQVPGAVFTNVENDSPDLQVKKLVSSSVSGYTPPADAEFTFHLERNGRAYANAVYTVTDSNGDPVKRQVAGFTAAWRTDSRGDFKLKAGWTATFSFFGNGALYEVTETNIPADFIQKQPSFGAGYAGTVRAQGTVLTFTNVYIPPDEDNEYTDMLISKEIVYPEDLELPETPEFLFLVELDGEPYAGKACTVTAEDGSVTQAVTDEAGYVRLKGRESARFEDVPVGVDYRVTESGTEGWRPVSKTVCEGVTTSRQTSVGFVNVRAAFSVTKEMYDHSTTEDLFTFVVTDMENLPVKGLAYWLHEKDGTLAAGEYQTSAAGEFSLKEGQTAVFYGMEPGDTYSVKEIPVSGYQQVSPVSTDGYTELTVTNTIRQLVFANESLAQSGLLAVTKRVVCEGGQRPLNEDEFTLLLAYAKTLTDTFAPAANASYTIRSGTTGIYTYRTSVEGLFKLKDGQTAVFADLPSGWYRIIEQKEDGGKINADYREVQVLTDGTVKEAAVEEDQAAETVEAVLADALHCGEKDEDNLYFEVINQYRMKYVHLSVHKRSDDDQPKSLAGAEFALYEDSILEDNLLARLVTGEDGLASFPALSVGTYYLQEISAPQGYGTDETPIEIVVTREKRDSDETEKMYLQINGTDCDESDERISISYDSQGDTTAVLAVTNENLRKGSITVVKQDGDENAQAGVTFTLTRKEDGELISEQTTPENGRIVFEELADDTYILTETAAKAGMSLLAEPVEIVLPLTMTEDEAGRQHADTTQGTYSETEHLWYFRNLTYVITNHAQFEMPMAGANSVWPVIAVLSAVVTAASGYFAFFRKHHKERHRHQMA